ncbi:MAG: hypothetical protein K8S27_07090 [Candidatus Omnitrophica bacterium]|nr:hypothetical protein [Candidatus Omnitrophota bacterium]
MKKMAVLSVHGMGETQRNYWSQFVAHLKKALGPQFWSQIHFEPIYYQHLIQDNEYRVWNAMPRDLLAWKDLRKFLLFGFADAGSLEHKAHQKNSVYVRTQKIIRKSLQKALSKLRNPQSPCVIIAHSLGCQVISNYIWDSNLAAPGGVWKFFPLDEIDETSLNFLKLKSLRLLFTTGCNIPLFVAGHNQIVAINKPNDNFEWYNFFDRDDVLGWPLKSLSPSYQLIVTEDIEVNSGNLLESWNPKSHTAYWRDAEVIGYIQGLMKDVLKQEMNKEQDILYSATSSTDELDP